MTLHMIAPDILSITSLVYSFISVTVWITKTYNYK